MWGLNARWDSLEKDQSYVGSKWLLDKEGGADLPLTCRTEAPCVRSTLVPGFEMFLVTLSV